MKELVTVFGRQSGQEMLAGARCTEFSVPKSKLIVDECERVPESRYGFTDEELDLIPSTMLRTGINYDIRYRLGQGGGEEGDDE